MPITHTVYNEYTWIPSMNTCIGHLLPTIQICVGAICWSLVFLKKAYRSFPIFSSAFPSQKDPRRHIMFVWTQHAHPSSKVKFMASWQICWHHFFNHIIYYKNLLEEIDQALPEIHLSTFSQTGNF